MTGAPTAVVIREWTTRRPDPRSGLEGLAFANNQDRVLAEELGKSGLLEVTELRAGLMIRSFSYVGTVRLGAIEITVLPKIDRASLLNLLRYAYGFRNLRLLPEASHSLDKATFQDLLVSQLNAEAADLVARGLHRAYVPKSEALQSPRGRIDIGRLAQQGGVVTASLPCTHHPRIEDSLLNRTLLAGLALAGNAASDLHLRRESRRLSVLFGERVSPVRLHAELLDRCSSQVNRLTAAYGPAIQLIRLIWDAQGVTLGGAGRQQALPGFLFDMNKLFQSLLSRYLRENLPGHSVRDEFRLTGLIKYVPGFNPRSRRAPTPRPDFVVMRGHEQAAVIDAKYRDLWEQSLPREMLYQVALYAASNDSRSATILYPTTDGEATEARITVADPVVGRQAALVCLRPVVVSRIEDLVMSHQSATLERQRRAYAEALAFGSGALPPRVRQARSIS